jgi:AraC-like DNA-binding protein
MTHRPCHQHQSPVADHGQARRLLGVARQLFAQRGPSVTLSEIAMAASPGGGESRCSDVVGLLLAQRLGDLLDIARTSPDLQRQEVVVPHVISADVVREIVLAHLDRGDLSLRTVARMLAVSSRTLQRRLADEGTSWRAIVDTTRREHATTLLREGATADAIAARVGYAGSRALRRALRRWRANSLSARGDRG